MKCAAHPDEEIVGPCARCGDFACARDSERRGERLLCLACATGEPERLRAFKDELWGKRDGYAWYYGVVVASANLLFAIEYLALGISMARPHLVAGSIASALALAIDLAYFFRLRFARTVVVFLPLLGGVITLLAPGMRSSWERFAAVGGQVLFAQLIAVSGYLGARNKLFFRIDVSDDELAKLWDLHHNNPYARRGLFYALVGVVVPPLLVLACVFSAIGLTRVNPSARPPVGRRGHAIAGIIISIAAFAGWIALLALS